MNNSSFVRFSLKVACLGLLSQPVGAIENPPRQDLPEATRRISSLIEAELSTVQKESQNSTREFGSSFPSDLEQPLLHDQGEGVLLDDKTLSTIESSWWRNSLRWVSLDTSLQRVAYSIVLRRHDITGEDKKCSTCVWRRP